jgi:hypothetical protein
MLLEVALVLSVSPVTCLVEVINLIVSTWHDLKELAGYSWKTNQFGLGVDTMVEYELVLPNGQVTVVTEKKEDLWFALKVRLSSGKQVQA